ncbi:MAG: 16S rRNA (cytidine(1402)-2'-O)-methyltransferase [Rhodothalassiaceae bacterium]
MKSDDGNSLSAGLHVVATPIGNLGDISGRALETLRRADVIACEDTRHSRRLLTHFGISRPLMAFHEHSGREVVEKLVERMREGAAIALITDAGTPGISDPGYVLVRAVQDAGLPVHAVPGPSALAAALSIAGLPAHRVLFAGFPPDKAGARARQLESLAPLDATLVFLESPRRIAGLVSDCLRIFGPREAAICRELSKRHEETVRAPLAALAEKLRAGEIPARGEFVLLIAPPAEPAATEPGEIDRMLIEAFGTMSLREAVDAVSAATNIGRRIVYQRALALRDMAS